MRSLLTFISVLFISSNVMADNLHKFTINDIDGNLINLNQFKGKPVLLVNTASRCGFTKQYSGVQELDGKYNQKVNKKLNNIYNNDSFPITEVK